MKPDPKSAVPHQTSLGWRVDEYGFGNGIKLRKIFDTLYVQVGKPGAGPKDNDAFFSYNVAKENHART